MKHIKLTILALSSIAFLNCGGKEEKKKAFSYDTEPVTQTMNAKAEPGHEETSNAMALEDKAVAEVMIHGDDKMTFNLKEIRVKKGQTVKLTLMHTGKMVKNVMGHNFVLLKKGVDMAKFAGMAASAADHDYVPEGADNVIAYTKLLGGGESDTIEFEAPEPGTYEFLCSFPGHYALMKGKFIVE